MAKQKPRRAESKKLRIGIVTFEYPGYTRNGGIGTAYGRLAMQLAADGHRVTVIFVETEAFDKKLFRAEEVSQHRNIKFETCSNLPEYQHLTFALARSLSVHRQVEAGDYDVIHFHDCLGFGWVSTQLKKFNLAFQNTQIVVGLHGPHSWVVESHGRLSTDRDILLESQLEKESVENADLIVGPSQYMVDYLRSLDWQLPDQKVRVIPNVNGFDDAWSKTLAKELSQIRIASRRVDSLIFFGRLESRKGLRIFLDALKLLGKDLVRHLRNNQPMKVVFMGKDTRLVSERGRMASAVIREELKSLQTVYNVKLMMDMSSTECARYFREHSDSLICLPSLADNSPYTVVEAMEQRLNFITSSAGGQKELLDSISSYDAVFAPDAKSMSQKVLDKLTTFYDVPMPSDEALNANENWSKLHFSIGASLSKRPKLQRKTRERAFKKNVAVVYLTQGLSSGFPQTFGPLLRAAQNAAQLIVLSSNSRPRDAQGLFNIFSDHIDGVPVKFIHTLALSPAEIVAKALREANSSHFLFIRDGEFLSSEGLDVCETLTRSTNYSAYLFSYLLGTHEFHPQPVEVNHALFADSYLRFPTLLSRKFLEARLQSQPTGASNIDDWLGIDNSELIADGLGQRLITVVPHVLIEAKYREPYRTEIKPKPEVIMGRVKKVTTGLPLLMRKSLELSAAFVLENSRS